MNVDADQFSADPIEPTNCQSFILRGSLMLTCPTAAKLADFDFTQGDKTRVIASLSSLHLIIEDAIEGLIEHLHETDAARYLVGVKAGVIHQTLTEHWMRLFSEGIDETYACQINRLGIACRERGIPAEIYMIAHGWLASRLAAEIVRFRGEDPERCAELVAAVLKLVFFDMTRALHAWDVTLVD